ncbi:Lysophospholipid acyltransferase 1 [Chelonia mydas]|uniref:Lysophospholipid acyltransferase 1 n=1 Tax=Chelonia mydas TaxID=8469 RepID=M7BR90_CHEMY|nr:Lysophospholipid acyltransferase 1 [Chelonia mydas]
MAEAPGVPYRTTGSTLLHPLSQLLGIPLDQVRPIAAPTDRGSQFQANDGCRKRRGPRDVLAAVSHSLRWPGMANHGQWELQSAEPADAAAELLIMGLIVSSHCCLGMHREERPQEGWCIMVNFVACQLFALLAAFWFRIYLSPSNVSSVVRHAFATLFGIYFAVFCFGWYSIHIFVLVMMSYGIMNIASIPNIHRYSFVVAMGYLTLCHISRIYIFNYGILTTDFSGGSAFSIVTLTWHVRQREINLAAEEGSTRCQSLGATEGPAAEDPDVQGIGRRPEDLTAEQNRLAVKIRPSLLEYLSYLLNFMSVIAGPCSNYKDYIAFIEGRHVHMKLLEVNWKQKGYDRLPDPSPTGAVIYKLCITFVSLLLFLTLTKTYPVTYIVDSQFINNTSFLSRLGYLYIAMQASKPKYYFAWTLADAVNNAAGYGFSGVDEQGNFHWDLLSNLNIWNIETATSFKMYIENWNIQTAAWLKRVCYDRAPWYPTALTFILSALWHGVYPGYYFTFITGLLMTLASRAIRNNYRHYFLSSKSLKVVYDIVTWFVTQLAVCYTVAPFVMLAVEPTIKLYKLARSLGSAYQCDMAYPVVDL